MPTVYGNTLQKHSKGKTSTCSPCYFFAGKNIPHAARHTRSWVDRAKTTGKIRAMSIIQRISIMGSIVFALGAGASAGELPQFEVTGFPISPLQMSVLNSGRVQEESPNPELLLHGMLVSPHQAAVLIGPQSPRCVCSRDGNAVHLR
jgi:hypothetical protein